MSFQSVNFHLSRLRGAAFVSSPKNRRDRTIGYTITILGALIRNFVGRIRVDVIVDATEHVICPAPMAAIETSAVDNSIIFKLMDFHLWNCFRQQNILHRMNIWFLIETIVLMTRHVIAARTNCKTPNCDDLIINYLLMIILGFGSEKSFQRA